MYCRIFAKKIVCLSCMHFYRNHFVVYHYGRERYRRTYQMSDCSFSLLLELSRTARAGNRELACSCAARGSDGGRGCLGGDAGREARARVGLAGPADQARRRQKSPPGKESSTSEAGTCFLMHHCCMSRQQLLITTSVVGNMHFYFGIRTGKNTSRLKCSFLKICGARCEGCESHKSEAVGLDDDLGDLLGVTCNDAHASESAPRLQMGIHKGSK